MILPIDRYTYANDSVPECSYETQKKMRDKSTVLHHTNL